MRRINFLIATWLLFFLAVNPAVAAIPAFTNIYYFGDSLSDVGNYVPQNFVPCLDVPAPVTNPTGGLYPKQLWVNFFSQMLGAGAVTPGSLTKLNGNDWAVAEAPTYSIPQQGLVQQAQNFVGYHKRLDPNALYVVWGGSNDLLAALRAIQSQPQRAKQIVAQTIAKGMTDMVAIISTLWHAGARNFVIVSVPDLSKTPLALSLSAADQNNIQQVAGAWNLVLFNPKNQGAGSAPLVFMKNVAKAAGQPIKIYTVDTFVLLNLVAAEPMLFGFTHGANEMWCGANQGLDPDTFVFFNLIHPTAKAHMILANNAINEGNPF